MKSGDVIVAIYGVHIQNVLQYEYKRDNSTNLELDLIAWRGDGYHEIKTSPPNHRFGVDSGAYRRK